MESSDLFILLKVPPLDMTLGLDLPAERLSGRPMAFEYYFRGFETVTLNGTSWYFMVLHGTSWYFKIGIFKRYFSNQSAHIYLLIRLWLFSVLSNFLLRYISRRS